MEQDYRDMLKDHGLSVTSVRLAMLGVLDGHAHADADTIFNAVFKEIATTSKQAIYNNLHTLVAHGLIREIKPKGLSCLYELRVGDNHHHIVCRSCGKVVDVDCVVGRKPCLTPSDDHDFLIDEAEVTFWGICPSCQKNK
ncbi:MAG: transcriptional repressor [Phycisphaeraceae bacterium]|nr:transcriptional repressor [Phycisphaeraceae bacterium]